MSYNNPCSFTQGLYRSIADTPVKNYARRSAAGEVFFNPLDIVSLEKRIVGNADLFRSSIAFACTGPNTVTTYRDTGTVFTQTCASAAFGADLITNDERVRVEKEATTKLWAERGSGLTNLVESFAEIEQAWAMIRSPLENVKRFIESFPAGSRKGKIRRVIHRGKTTYEFAASEWLRFRYGISPLMKDATAVLEALHKGHPKKPIRVTSRSTGQISKTTVVPGSWSNVDMKIDYTVTTMQSISYRCTSLDEWMPTIWSDLGFTLKNVLAVGWELTHLSFVADWFVNMGDYIYGHIPVPHLRQLGCCTTIRTEYRNVVVPGAITNLRPSVWATMSGPLDGSYLIHKRTYRQPTVDQPSLTVRSDFRFDHFNRVADLVALIPALLEKFTFLSVKTFHDDVLRVD